MISGTGSLRGSASASTCDSNSSGTNTSHISKSTLQEGPLSTESSTTVIEDDCFTYSSNHQDVASMRRDRLQSVRTLFYNSYCSTIKFKNGQQDSGLGSLLGNFAEKVGIRTTQRTSV
ncbi:hypothetical protein J437_LFUL001738 [Ladona fulva]|uniref:Uncharacterized protein n=1 Tax=Ladona fulva TaxID=123851 RepID=A0A8K0K1N5_LADFU|nr:hypothetical protein J437_LFUL001738 [Ladona fulva]